jgi:hypothetical protein
VLSLKVKAADAMDACTRGNTQRRCQQNSPGVFCQSVNSPESKQPRFVLSECKVKVHVRVNACSLVCAAMACLPAAAYSYALLACALQYRYINNSYEQTVH